MISNLIVTILSTYNLFPHLDYLYNFSLVPNWTDFLVSAVNTQAFNMQNL